MGRWLSAFVDDEPELVDALRSCGVQAHSFDVLTGLRVRELRATLTAGAPGAPSGRGHSSGVTVAGRAASQAGRGGAGLPPPWLTTRGVQFQAACAV